MFYFLEYYPAPFVTRDVLPIVTWARHEERQVPMGEGPQGVIGVSQGLEAGEAEDYGGVWAPSYKLCLCPWLRDELQI